MLGKLMSPGSDSPELHLKARIFGLERVIMAIRCLHCYEAVLVEFHIPYSNGEVI
jgi:hypothetical protein